MNIFVLDLNPEKCAQYHCDKHVVKMILESTQLLSTTHHLYPGEKYEYIKDLLYKPTHENHPCTKWVREDLKNYSWLLQLLHYLHYEYLFRYGKLHKSRSLFRILSQNLPNLPDENLTPFAQAMPEQYKSENPVQSYRDYYINEKRDICKWYNQIPEWWEDKNNKDMGIWKKVLELPKNHPTRIRFETEFFNTREPKEPTLSIKKGDLVEIKDKEGVWKIIKYSSNKEILVINMNSLTELISKDEIIQVISGEIEIYNK